VFTAQTTTGADVGPTDVISHHRYRNILPDEGLCNAGCIVHCNKVRKPVKGKYFLLCMISIMYLLLT